MKIDWIVSFTSFTSFIWSAVLFGVSLFVTIHEIHSECVAMRDQCGFLWIFCCFFLTMLFWSCLGTLFQSPEFIFLSILFLGMSWLFSIPLLAAGGKQGSILSFMFYIPSFILFDLFIIGCVVAIQTFFIKRQQFLELTERVNV